MNGKNSSKRGSRNSTFLIGSVLIIAGLFLAVRVDAGRSDGFWNSVGTYLKTTRSTGYNLLINGSNHFINFGVTSGASGYGIRDNGGVIEVKNSGGAWEGIATSTSSSFNGFISSASSTINSTLHLTGALTSSSTATSTFNGDMDIDGALSLGGFVYDTGGFLVWEVDACKFFDGSSNPVVSLETCSRILVNDAGTTVLEWDDDFTVLNASMGIGTSTPTGKLSIDSGTTATTTVTLGDIETIGAKDSPGCIQMAGANGQWYRLFINVTSNALVTEQGTC